MFTLIISSHSSRFFTLYVTLYILLKSIFVQYLESFVFTILFFDDLVHNLLFFLLFKPLFHILCCFFDQKHKQKTHCAQVLNNDILHFSHLYVYLNVVKLLLNILPIMIYSVINTHTMNNFCFLTIATVIATRCLIRISIIDTVPQQLYQHDYKLTCWWC